VNPGNENTTVLFYWGITNLLQLENPPLPAVNNPLTGITAIAAGAPLTGLLPEE
jgi:hypothetical protein